MLSARILNTIKAVAQEELKELDQNRKNKLWDVIHDVFDLWKLTSGNRQPSIPSGLLNTNTSSQNIRFEDAEPWQCADLIRPSRLNLALMLIRKNDPIFSKLFTAELPSVILSLLIVKEIESNNKDDDLFFAYDHLVQIQTRDIALEQGALAALRLTQDDFKTGKQTKKHLAIGRDAAAKIKSEKANAYHALWETWAKETWKANQFWSVDQVAEHVLNIANKMNHKMANGNLYKQSYIKQIIKGVRKTLKTENPVSGQKNII